MRWTPSIFGNRFSSATGISLLMDDLGQALANPSQVIAMLGGGNPARIPGIESMWRERLQALASSPEAAGAMLGNYDTPRGTPAFLRSAADLFRREFGWEVGPDHVAVTTGSQTTSFLLFQMLAGETPAGFRKILFPVVPEYIGYPGAAGDPLMLAAWRPEIERFGDRSFKYRIAFREVGPEIAAICVSRPTNPTANVVTDDELEHLSELARDRGLFLIIDNAYGAPFPGVIFRPTRMPFGEHIIHLFSLSKIGLPGTRTGIVVANPEMIRRISAFNANLVLATCGVGQALAGPLFDSGELTRVCREIARPFYEERCARALAILHEELPEEIPWRVHVPEGAFFLWLWIPGLPGGCRRLYEQLKGAGVIVVPGDYFFAGLDSPWDHARECLRLSYCTNEAAFRAGAGAIARLLKEGRSR